jgi:type III pantothenate kinase
VPSHAIGRNTTTAIQAGVVLGHLKMVEALVEMAREELEGCDIVVSTGGNGALFAEQSSVLGPYVPTLTLDGLRYIAARAMEADLN